MDEELIHKRERESDSEGEKSDTESDKDGIDQHESFDDMELNDAIVRGLYAYGLERPSYIQQVAIVPMSKGRDIIAQAQSGTGKTVTFVSGSLQRFDQKLKKCQILIIVHTHELAKQIKTVYESIGTYMDLKLSLCIGKTNIYDSKDEIDKGTQIIVGTPGRIGDMLRRKFLPTKHLSVMIMDEGDELLSMGFRDQMRDIMEYIPKKTQLCFFSATIPRDISEIMHSVMDNPLPILVKKEALTLEGIKQFYIPIEKEEWKLEVILDIYGMLKMAQSIVYVNTVRKTQALYDSLTDAGFSVLMSHGKMPPEERDAVLTSFRKCGSRVLITSDLLARGIDIQQVSVVINYDMPRHLETYIHRIGRSGRFGRKGVAINFVTQDDARKLQKLREFYNTQIEEMPTSIADFI
jgi:translation initiation factor 4A